MYDSSRQSQLKSPKKVANGYWDIKENQRNFLDGLGKQLGFKRMEDWHNVSANSIRQHGGGTLLTKFGDSPSKCIISIYSNHVWNQSNFSTTLSGYWNNQNNRRDFMDWLGQQLGFKQMDDWRHLTVKQIVSHGGHSVLQMYSSPFELVTSTYGSYSWHVVQEKTSGHLGNLNKSSEAGISIKKNETSEMRFLNWLGSQLGFKQMNDWYNITVNQIIENGGMKFLSKYEKSPAKLVMSVYNKHQWNKSNFNSRLPQRYWKNKENRISIMKNLESELKISDPDDWYRVSFSQINQVHKHMGLFQHYSLENLLQEVYPDHQWKEKELQQKGRFSKASQRWLKVRIQEIFPQSGSHQRVPFLFTGI